MWDVWSGEPFGCTIVNGVVVSFLSTCGLSGDRKVSVHPESAYALLLARKFVRWVEVNAFEITLFILLLPNLSVAPLFQKYAPCHVL